MLVYAIRVENFYTAEHGLHNYVHFCKEFSDAQQFVKHKYNVEVNELGVDVVFDEDNEDYGDQSVMIDVINIEG